MATDGLYALYSTQFSTVLELKLQQMGSKLRGLVREGFHVGKMASPVNQVGAIQTEGSGRALCAAAAHRQRLHSPVGLPAGWRDGADDRQLR